MTITKEQARRFLLMYHGLYDACAFKGKHGILQFIHRVGCIQFDPLNIAGHNHELVLQSRIRGFTPQMLYDLLYIDRKLLDGWDKNMSIYPVEDWPSFSRVRQNYARWLKSKPQTESALPRVLEEIRRRGPLSSKDLDHKERVDWFWAPTSLARASLESLFYTGDLVVHHKKRTFRYFDLPDRCLPKSVYNQPDPFDSEEAYLEWYAARRIGGIGLLWNKAGDGWLGMANFKSPERTRSIQNLLEKGLLTEIHVDGVGSPLYMRTEYLDLLQKVVDGFTPSPSAHIMAPLDNLLWERKLLSELFGFDYRWEVYKPVEQRTYGYYVLPVLYGDRFIARFEPGRDGEGNLIIKNWWWEPGVKVGKRIQASLMKCFEAFQSFLGAERIIGLPF